MNDRGDDAHLSRGNGSSQRPLEPHAYQKPYLQLGGGPSGTPGYGDHPDSGAALVPYGAPPPGVGHANGARSDPRVRYVDVDAYQQHLPAYRERDPRRNVQLEYGRNRVYSAEDSYAPTAKIPEPPTHGDPRKYRAKTEDPDPMTAMPGVAPSRYPGIQAYADVTAPVSPSVYEVDPFGVVAPSPPKKASERAAKPEPGFTGCAVAASTQSKPEPRLVEPCCNEDAADLPDVLDSDVRPTRATQEALVRAPLVREHAPSESARKRQRLSNGYGYDDERPNCAQLPRPTAASAHDIRYGDLEGDSFPATPPRRSPRRDGAEGHAAGNFVRVDRRGQEYGGCEGNGERNFEVERDPYGPRHGYHARRDPRRDARMHRAIAGPSDRFRHINVSGDHQYPSEVNGDDKCRGRFYNCFRSENFDVRPNGGGRRGEDGLFDREHSRYEKGDSGLHDGCGPHGRYGERGDAYTRRYGSYNSLRVSDRERASEPNRGELEHERWETHPVPLSGTERQSSAAEDDDRFELSTREHMGGERRIDRERDSAPERNAEESAWPAPPAHSPQATEPGPKAPAPDPEAARGSGDESDGDDDFIPNNVNGEGELTADQKERIPPAYHASGARMELVRTEVRKYTKGEEVRCDLLHAETIKFVDGEFEGSFNAQLQRAVKGEVTHANKRKGGRRRRAAKSQMRRSCR